ncbi:autotransporter family protein [Brucella sp. 22210]|uniref:autotransporter family protein n=1 Tax=Brucella sp. 22210 TaxID=3453892 RepID=UPI003F855C27
MSYKDDEGTKHTGPTKDAGGYGNGGGGSSGSKAYRGESAADGVGGNGGSVGDRQGGKGGQVGANTIGTGAIHVTGGRGGDGVAAKRGWGNTGSGGGGGGAGVFLNGGKSTLTSGSVVTGGQGGKGSSGNLSVAGGSGGGGGAGIIVRGATLTNLENSRIVGGDGGDAIDNTFSSSEIIGGGGNGGDGVVVDHGATFINKGSVAGGRGGARGADTTNTVTYPEHTAGNAGSGIRIGEEAYVINAGSVKAGDKVDGAPDDVINAIDVVGDHSTLELWDGSNIQGNVVVADGVKDSSLVLGGEANSSLNAAELGDKYKGFENFKKTGASKWDLTGKTDAHTPWTIAEGVLSITEDGSLGDAAGTLTIDGGTLQTAGAFDMARNVVIGDKNGTIDTQGNTNTMNGVISGAGNLTKDGAGVLVLAGDNTFTGEAKIDKGELRLAGQGSIASAARVDNNGVFDISGVDPDSATIKSLAGNKDGRVKTGDKTLVIADGNGSDFAGVIDGTGGLSIDKGKQIISGDNIYTGDTKIASAGELQLVNDERAGNITSDVINDGILSGNGSMNGLVNRGTVSPGTDKDFGTLTVNGDYSSENGKLVMHQVLGDDNSQGDRLVVKGNTSGTTEVSVINRGGMGAQTVNGIKIVEVGGQSDGQFNLHGDYVNYNNEQAVVAGAYAYTLNKGGVSSPDDGNWYLRSEDKNKKGENGNGGNGNRDNGDNGKGGNGGHGKGGNGGKEYQAGVPVYGGISSALAGINRAGFASFGTRMSSNGRNGNANAYRIANPDSLFGEKYVWGRIQTGYTRLTPSGNATGAVYGSNDWTMQAGLDGQFIDDEDGELFGSVWLDYTSSSIKSRSDVGNGRVNVKGFGLGGALTWYGENGYYIDGQGKLTWYKSDLESDLVQQALATGVKSFGYALSLEAGQKFVVSDQWSVTPQVQLIWSSLSTNNYVDVFSAAINTPDNNVLTGRFGIAANFAQSWVEADGSRTRLDFGGIANIYQDLKSGADYINVSDVNIATGTTDKTWGELGLTANYSWNDDTYSVFGKVSTATSLQNVGKSYNVSGNVGFKVKW